MDSQATNNTELKWYVLKSYAGQENTVVNNITQRIKANSLEEQITELIVPTNEQIIIKAGKKKTIQEKFLPGYILVHMVLNDKTWHVVRNTQGVTGFIGIEKKPTPLDESEVKGIMSFMKIKQPTYQTSLEVGDTVKVTDGPFTDFMGSISEINENKGQVKVLLSVFGQETPTVLDLLSVKRVTE